MNVKKAGLISAGVLTALLAVAPLASATEGAHGQACSFTAGDAGAASQITGGTANVVTQTPTAGGNEDNDENCSNFDNNNGNGNGSNNADSSSITDLLPIDILPLG